MWNSEQEKFLDKICDKLIKLGDDTLFAESITSELKEAMIELEINFCYKENPTTLPNYSKEKKPLSFNSISRNSESLNLKSGSYRKNLKILSKNE